MNKHAETYRSFPSKESDQKYIVEEISLRHQLDSAPDVADNAIANEIRSGTAHGIQSVIKPQDNVNEVPIHRSDSNPGIQFKSLSKGHQ